MYPWNYARTFLSILARILARILVVGILGILGILGVRILGILANDASDARTFFIILVVNLIKL